MLCDGDLPSINSALLVQREEAEDSSSKCRSMDPRTVRCAAMASARDPTAG